ncbi:uncharacterized protein LOC130668063 [Microplitis mediator]|uniref:uncharacterized protein LOC130668063 n=1 Tax=Microplitis mediator TaxID=375433 RepID=UPI002553C9BE|nr:uncharacterized protein LOC130668063 [Microplitis mediator]
MLRVFIHFCIIAGAFADYVGNGSCPDVNAEKPLDLNRMSGLWIRYGEGDHYWDKAQKCGQQYWSSPNNEGISTIVSTSISTKNNKMLEIIGEVSLITNNRVSFNHHVPILGSIRRECNYIGVDYDKYIVAWTCVNNGTTHTETPMIFTRERNPTFDVLKVAGEVYARYGLKLSHVIRENQDCI